MPSWTELRTDRVLWEDDRALVLDKPAGISVMGERHGSDLDAMARGHGEDLRWVHRIDKATTGALLLAKGRQAHGMLTRQFAHREVGKAYLAVTAAEVSDEWVSIDLPLLTAGSGRIRVAALREDLRWSPEDRTWSVAPERLLPKRSFPAQTHVRRVWRSPSGESVLLVRPVTGRRHQIRVHLAWTGAALLGDPLFGAKGSERVALHSWQLGFDAPWRGETVAVEAAPDARFWGFAGCGEEFDPGDVVAGARRLLSSGPPGVAS